MTPQAWAQLAGVLVGFFLSQFATLAVWLLAERRERQLVRLLVSLEIDQNLSLVQEFWHNVALPPDPPFTEEEDEDDADSDFARSPPAPPPPPVVESEATRLSRRAADIPLPPFRERAFESQLGALPKALTAEEIKGVWRVYEELAQIRTVHSWLLDVSADGDGERPFPSASAPIRAQGLTSATFTAKKYGVLFDLKGRIAELLRQGNPLKAPAKKS